MDDIKKQLVEHIKKQLNIQINNAQAAVDSAIESKSNETKSSAGDKFETGRAMMQIEQEKHEMQLAKAQDQLKYISRISLDPSKDDIQLGSLVITDQLKYFITIGQGKIVIGNMKYYAISVDSPIGRLLIGKKRGDAITFRDKIITILDIT